jgi:hypothetical protein
MTKTNDQFHSPCHSDTANHNPQLESSHNRFSFNHFRHPEFTGTALAMMIAVPNGDTIFRPGLGFGRVAKQLDSVTERRQ